MRHGKPRSAVVRAFIAGFVSVIAGAMVNSGKGYKRESLRNRGQGDDRRGDKLVDRAAGVSKMMRQYRARYESVPFKPTPHGRPRKAKQ